MKKSKFRWMALMMALLLTLTSCSRESSLAPAETLPPPSAPYAAPTDDTGLDYERDVALYLPAKNGQTMLCFWRTAALAACSLAALLYLGQLSVRLAGGEEMQVVDTEQIYTGAQGIKAKIPAGYTLLEETVQPETDETYAYYGFDTYNDRIGYSLGKVVDMIPEEITSVDEISDHCAQRDSAFYTGGFIAPTQRPEIGGREMLCSEGYITENPELVYAVYDMLYEGSLVTATFRYEKKDYGKRETRLRIESLLKGIELE